MTFAFVRKFRHQFKRAPAKDSHSQLLSPPAVNDSQANQAKNYGSVQSSLCSMNGLPQDPQQINSPGSTQSSALINPTMPGLGFATAAIETPSIGPKLVQGLKDVSMGDVNAPMLSNNNIQQIQRAAMHYHYSTQESSSNGRFTVIKEGDIFLQNESHINGYPGDIIREFTGTVMDSPKFIRSYYGKDGLKSFQRDYKTFCAIPRNPYLLQLYGLCRSPGLTALIFHRGPDIAEAIEYCNKLTDPFEFCLHSYKLVRQYKSAENMLIQHCGLRIKIDIWQANTADINGNLIVQPIDDYCRLSQFLYDSRKVDHHMSHILECFETKTFNKHNLLMYYCSYEETKATDELGIQLTLLPGMLIHFRIPTLTISTGIYIDEEIIPLSGLRGNTDSEAYHNPFTVWACQAHLLLQNATRSSLDKLTTTIMLFASVVLEIRPHQDSQLQTHAEGPDLHGRYLYLFSHPPTRTSWEKMDRGNYFWATDGKGEHRIEESLIQEVFGVSVRCDWDVDWCEFPPRYYSVLHDIHIACGFNPYSTEIAEYLGVPLYVREQDASGLQECSDSESSDCPSSSCSNYASANGDMEEPE
ncbi:hypothetical protein C8J56DRAFT_1164169 [Mycena floridula]|nr:hypothetical protein C8J56DRAFT_1164169 [Mycena floridula]